MIDFDTQDKYPLPSVRAWLREQFGGWGWHEWMAAAWCFLVACLVSLAVLTTQGCVGSYVEQKKDQAVGGVTRFATGNPSPSPHGDGGSLVVLWWGGLSLCVVAFASFVLSFVPAVGLLFSRKMALSCGFAGVGCLLIYDFMVEWRWLIYVLLAIGAACWVIGNWAAIRNPRELVRQLWEFVTNRDSNKDGHIGPKW